MSETPKALTLEEKWENATIANNFIFYKVMRNNPSVCKELLEILLEFKIENIQMSQEEEIAIDFGSKGIRMDVYVKDKDGQKVYNIELQTTDTGELPERARYYQGVIDIDILRTGQKYKDLKTTFIIFICIDDIFKKGLAKYTFENICLEDKETKLGDRTQKLFFISKNCDKLLNERQKAFLRLVTSNSSSDTFTEKITKLVAEAKRNTQWRMQYMEWEREKVYEYYRGREEGAKQTAIENAKKLYANGVSVEIIAKSLGMTEEQIKEIVKNEEVTA
ncbi:MAG: Rpn family recombination-promoting nuclease/putative transposase [Treponema sp.]|nr:Rpn family recombination-promoting nuclease/putative transposase [Treponema sp.]